MNTFAQNLNSVLVAKMIPAEGDAFVTMHPRALEQANLFNDKLQEFHGSKELTAAEEEAVLAGVTHVPTYYGAVVDGVVQPMDEEQFELALAQIEGSDMMSSVVAAITKATVDVVNTTDKLKI